MSDKIDNGVKPTTPIQIIVDGDLVNEDNERVEEVKEDEPPNVVIMLRKP